MRPLALRDLKDFEHCDGAGRRKQNQPKDVTVHEEGNGHDEAEGDSEEGEDPSENDEYRGEAGHHSSHAAEFQDKVFFPSRAEDAGSR